MNRSVSGPLVFINGNLDAQRYKSIIENNLLPFANTNMPQGWALYQDNAPCHKSQLLMGRVVRLANGGKVRLPGFFAAHRVELIKAPPYSPDLNVIEHLWAHLKAKLKGRRFNSKVDAYFFIRNVWRQLSLGILRDLVDSMPRRIKAVIVAKGGPTKY